jgi:hypothetical protein
MPSWYAALTQIDADPSGQHVYFNGWNKSTNDTVGVGLLSLADGSMTQWASIFADRGYLIPLADGSVFFGVAQTEENISLFKLTGPGQMQRIGAPARPVRLVTVSQDLKHAVASERDYRADAWMNKVIKP